MEGGAVRNTVMVCKTCLDKPNIQNVRSCWHRCMLNAAVSLPFRSLESNKLFLDALQPQLPIFSPQITRVYVYCALVLKMSYHPFFLRVEMRKLFRFLLIDSVV